MRRLSPAALAASALLLWLQAAVPPGRMEAGAQEAQSWEEGTRRENQRLYREVMADKYSLKRIMDAGITLRNGHFVKDGRTLAPDEVRQLLAVEGGAVEALGRGSAANRVSENVPADLGAGELESAAAGAQRLFADSIRTVPAALPAAPPTPLQFQEKKTPEESAIGWALAFLKEEDENKALLDFLKGEGKDLKIVFGSARDPATDSRDKGVQDRWGRKAIPIAAYRAKENSIVIDQKEFEALAAELKKEHGKAQSKVPAEKLGLEAARRLAPVLAHEILHALNDLLLSRHRLLVAEDELSCYRCQLINHKKLHTDKVKTIYDKEGDTLETKWGGGAQVFERYVLEKYKDGRPSAFDNPADVAAKIAEEILDLEPKIQATEAAGKKKGLPAADQESLNQAKARVELLDKRLGGWLDPAFMLELRRYFSDLERSQSRALGGKAPDRQAEDAFLRGTADRLAHYIRTMEGNKKLASHPLLERLRKAREAYLKAKP